VGRRGGGKGVGTGDEEVNVGGRLGGVGEGEEVGKADEKSDGGGVLQFGGSGKKGKEGALSFSKKEVEERVRC